jgi:hypothetical protein
MVLDLNAKGLIFDRVAVEGENFEDFDKKFKLLKPAEVKSSLTVTTSIFQNVLGQTVPCVGCRRSVERLYSTIAANNYATLDPIRIRNGIGLSVCEKYLQSSQLMCTLLYEHDVQLNKLLENQPRNKKNSRCNLHSLESFRPFTRPFSETWYETWDCMKKNCREKITVVDAHELHATLDEYLKKHKFCQECRTKVEKAYNLLMNEANPAKEKGYVTQIYNGIKRCLKDKHIHLPIETDYIDDLIKRAEPEIIGSHSRHRERHAKTMEIAQEEVLTCIGMCIYNRLRKIQQCVKEEENACQVLAAVAVHALCRSFDMAVENKRGVNVDLIYDEMMGEDRAKEQQVKKRKMKKKKKRNDNKKMKDDDDHDSLNCEPEPVVPCLHDCLDQLDEEEEEDDEQVHSEDEDDDSGDKIILCDGTVIDAVDFVSPPLNTTKMSSLSLSPSRSRSRSASMENLEVKADVLSVSSCHSCHNEGECAQRSVDAGYSSETQNDGLPLTNNNFSRTSSIASSPEGSEVECSDSCCNKPFSGDDSTYLTLEQMLVSCISIICRN